jgi:nucleoside-diphosphate-sugar epimerase/pimeloyl-ACP methyl ester carboxylesterase
VSAPQNAPRNTNDLPALAMSCPRKTIVITGATGFLGSHYLLWRMHGDARFLAIVRGSSPAHSHERLFDALKLAAASYNIPLESELVAQKVETLAGDITQPSLGLSDEDVAGLRDAHVDEVWHFASSLRFSERYRSDIEATNIGGCREAIGLAARIGAKRFVYVSTAYTCGRVGGDVHEVLHPLAGPFNNVYEETKCIAEHNAVRLTAEYGLDLRIVRPAAVVGPVATHRTGGSNTGLYGLAREIYRLRDVMNESKASITLRGDPDCTISFIPVDQTVRDMLMLERDEFPAGPYYNVTATQEQPLSAIVKAICDQAGVPLMHIEKEPAERSPLELLLDKHMDFYGGYFYNQKYFKRTLAHVNGVTRSDIEAYVMAQFRSLARRSEQRLFKLEPVRGADGVPLSAYYAGPADAPVVVLANAYGMPVDFWQPMGKRLAQRFRVITWESRFIPNTTVAFDANACSASLHHQDMARVMDHFGVEKAQIVSWCSGAQVALDFARSFPERAASLVLINGTYCMTPSVPRTDFLTSLLSISEKIAVDRRRAEMYVRLIYGNGDSGASSGDQKQLYSIMDGVDPFLLHLTSAPFRNPEALYRYASLFVQHFRGDELQAGAVDVPSLVVTAQGDVVAHHLASREVADRIENSRFMDIPGGDHFSMYFDEGLADTVAAFVAEHQPAPVPVREPVPAGAAS